MGLFAKYKKDRGEKRPKMGYGGETAILRDTIQKRPCYGPAFESMNSNLYKNPSLLYLGEQNLSLAKRYAKKRLAIVEDCPVSSRVLETWLLNEYVDGGNIVASTVGNNEQRLLKETVIELQNCLRADLIVASHLI